MSRISGVWSGVRRILDRSSPLPDGFCRDPRHLLAPDDINRVLREDVEHTDNSLHVVGDLVFVQYITPERIVACGVWHDSVAQTAPTLWPPSETLHDVSSHFSGTALYEGARGCLRVRIGQVMFEVGSYTPTNSLADMGPTADAPDVVTRLGVLIASRRA